MGLICFWLAGQLTLARANSVDVVAAASSSSSRLIAEYRRPIWSEFCRFYFSFCGERRDWSDFGVFFMLFNVVFGLRFAMLTGFGLQRLAQGLCIKLMPAGGTVGVCCGWLGNFFPPLSLFRIILRLQFSGLDSLGFFVFVFFSLFCGVDFPRDIFRPPFAKCFFFFFSLLILKSFGLPVVSCCITPQSTLFD